LLTTPIPSSETFENGATSKGHVHNIGHLLIATLISDIEISQTMLRNLITETITRNVIRVLERHPELAHLEPTKISDYRLQKSIEASKTSYRILMFLNVFCRACITFSAGYVATHMAVARRKEPSSRQLPWAAQNQILQ